MRKYDLINRVNKAWYLEKDGKKILKYVPKHAREDGAGMEYASAQYFGKNGKENVDLNTYAWEHGNKKHATALFALFEAACQGAKFHEQIVGGQDLGERYRYGELLMALAEELNPQLAGTWNETILHIAAKYGRTEAMDKLLERGADARAKTSVKGRTAEDYLMTYHKQQAKKKGISLKMQLAAEKEAQEKAKAERSLRQKAGIERR